jgi:DnaJ-class molecular chaperone
LAKFPTTCETCHDTSNWTNGKFNHTQTGWTLTGSHTVPPRACIDCHVNGNYNLTQTTCVTCHQADYNNAKQPVDHITANFPTTCETCHDTSSWTNGKFDHAQTGWALTGSHTAPPRACTDCHVNNNYKLTNTACVTCHLTDYNKTTDPNHVAAGFPQTCESCHDTVKWTDATFDHSKTGFPLTGAHVVPPRSCTDCHVNNNYKTLPTDCYGCHKTDYLNTNNPNHTAAHFPTTCATCHDTIKWSDGTFNHTWFNVNHGNANGICSNCHTNPNDYTVFTCTNCHGKTQTDQRHQGIRGYVYNSANCYQCHGKG